MRESEFDSLKRHTYELCMRNLGAKQLSKQLQIAQVIEQFIKDPNVVYILSVVAESFNISINELLTGKGRKNYRYAARGLVCYLIKNELDTYEIEQISFSLGWERSMCFEYLKFVKELNPDISDQKEMLRIRTDLEKKIKENKLKSNV